MSLIPAWHTIMMYDMNHCVIKMSIVPSLCMGSISWWRWLYLGDRECVGDSLPCEWYNAHTVNVRVETMRADHLRVVVLVPGFGQDVVPGAPEACAREGAGRFVAICSSLGGAFLGPDGMPRAVLWRPEALDCRLRIPPEPWNGFTRSPPSA